MDDPQLRAKLETLMLVYPDVTVARALHFLDEASAMLAAGGADYSGEPRCSRTTFAKLANDDTTQEIDASDIAAMRDQDFR